MLPLTLAAIYFTLLYIAYKFITKPDVPERNVGDELTIEDLID